MNPFKIYREWKELKRKEFLYKMKLSGNAERLLSRNGLTVGDLISILTDHAKHWGNNAPVQMELITEKAVTYKSVYDVVSDETAITICNWPQSYPMPEEFLADD